MKRDARGPSARPTGWFGFRLQSTLGGVLIAGVIAAAAAAPASAETPAPPNLSSAVNFLTTTTTANAVDGGTTLAGDGYYESFTDFADFGLTIDGAFALAATGTDNATLGKVVNFIEHGSDGSDRSIADWTATSPAFEVDGAFPFVASGAIGKEALLAEVVGDDPRAFAGQDLIADLDQEVCTTTSSDPNGPMCAAPGNYQNSSSTFDQTLAVLAQLRAGDDANAVAPIAYLQSLQEPSGAWSSAIPSDGSSDVDSTAVAVMALALVPGPTAAEAVTSGQAWIAFQQEADGGFPGASGDSINSAALALMALALDRAHFADQITAGHGFLAAQQNPDGGFNTAVGQSGSDVRASTQAVSGIVGTSLGTLFDPVNPPPNVSLGAPGDGAQYAPDAVPALSFTCTAGTNAELRSGLVGCSAIADGGAPVASGATLPSSPGVHQVTVTATDTDTQTTSRRASYTVAATTTTTTTTPPGPPLPTTTPPQTHRVPVVRISALRQSHKAWAHSSAHVARRPTSTTFSFTLNRAARLTLRFSRLQRGRMVGQRCVARTAGNARHPRCTYSTAAGTLSRNGHTGLNQLHSDGRVGTGRSLSPGTYLIVITARASGHTSSTKPLRFTILAPAKSRTPS